MPAVAVITRTRDRAMMLKRAGASVSGQTYREFIWVIVNDSGDPAPVDAVAEDAKRQGVEVLVVHHAVSRGMEAASNLGIGKCESEFLVIHDDDDSWDPRFLETTVGYLQSARGQIYGGVVTHAVWVEEEIQPTGELRTLTEMHSNDGMRAVQLLDVAGTNPFPPISFLYRRAIYDLVGGYDESLPVLGDWDFNLKFLLHADIGVITKPLANYHHRVNAAGTSFENSLNQHAEYKAIFRNRLLRKDVASGQYGLGHLVSVMSKLDELTKTVRYTDPGFVTRVISNLSSRALQRVRNTVPFRRGGR